MNIRRLFLRIGAGCAALVVLPVLASVPLFLPHQYDLSTVRAAQAAATRCGLQAVGDQVAIAGPSVICFHGLIDENSARRFLALPINDGSMLVLRSLGGTVEAALDMAPIIVAKHLVVVIDTFCMSACANYLFPAGAAKIVLDGGVVGFHGAPKIDGPVTITITDPDRPIGKLTQEQMAGWVALARENTRQLLVKQARFFQSIGVSIDLVDNFPLQRYRAQFKFDHTVWEYGPDTLRDRFGVRNIIYFQTPDKAGPLTRIRTYLFGVHCVLDNPDVWFCNS